MTERTQRAVTHGGKPIMQWRYPSDAEQYAQQLAEAYPDRRWKVRAWHEVVEVTQ